MPNFLRMHAVVSLGALVLFVAACGDEESLEIYTVPKGSETFLQPEQTATAVTGTPAPHGSTASGPAREGVLWQAPVGWQESTDPRPMRYTTFMVADDDGDIEVAVSHFPGDVGGKLNNVNRWRQQVGLATVSEAELDDVLITFSQPGFEAYGAHIEGPRQHMVVVGLWEPSAQRTWFVRAIVSPEQAERIREPLLDFARSFCHP